MLLYVLILSQILFDHNIQTITSTEGTFWVVDFIADKLLLANGSHKPNLKNQLKSKIFGEIIYS
jgi:hypothetical protein